MSAQPEVGTTTNNNKNNPEPSQQAGTGFGGGSPLSTPTLPSVQFSSNHYWINKDVFASAWVTVERKGDTAQAIKVKCFTAGGTATPDVDYVPVATTLEFAPGQLRRRVEIRMTDSLLSEESKTVDLLLSNPDRATLGEPYKAELLIKQRNEIHTFLTDRGTRRVIKHLALAATLILMIFGCTKMFSGIAERHAEEWTAYLQPKDAQKIVFPKQTPISDEAQLRLTDQLDRVRKRASLHLSIMRFFYTRYYMAILTFSISAALAAITLVLVSKRGWEQSNEYILTAFFVLSACTVFFGAFPNVFQQDQNIKENKFLFLRYEALENELLSYAVTNESLQKQLVATKAGDGSQETVRNRPLAPNEFIHYVDEQLAAGNIPIGFDYSQVPNYKKAFEMEKSP